MDWPCDTKKSAIQSAGPMDSGIISDSMDLNVTTTLPELYDQAERCLLKAECKQGSERQDLLQTARHSLEKATKFVTSLDLFSNNETIDEVATNNIKYLLLPALLTNIYMRLDLGQMQTSMRLEVFSKARSYAEDFLDKIKSYGLANSIVDQALVDESKEESMNNLSEIDMITKMAQSRKDKIDQYNTEKDMEQMLEQTKARIDSSNGDMDEEVVRSYYLNLIKKWTYETVREYKTIRSALRLEEGVQGQSGSERTNIRPAQNTRNTFTLVKSDLQKQVFGLGYPSHPTVTVDQFITKKINDGDLAFTAQKDM